MKKLSILILIVFIIPQITFASWWNPISWRVWNIFKPTPKIQQVQIEEVKQSTTTVSSNSEIEQLKKEVEELKKKQATKSIILTTQPSQKNNTTIQPTVSYPVTNPAPAPQIKTIPEISQADLNKGANIKAQTITLLNKILSDLSYLDTDYTNEISRLDGILNKSIGISDPVTVTFVKLTTGYKNIHIDTRNNLRGFTSQMDSIKRTMEGIDAAGYIKDFNPEINFAKEVQFVVDQKAMFLQYKAKYDDVTRDWLSF